MLTKFFLRASGVRSSDSFRPASEAGRHALAFWFRLRDAVDDQINRCCNQYYDDRHPKHYLWLGHNQYLYDQVQPGERVLDIGCGSSHYQQWIAEKAEEVVAVDVRPERVELARNNNQKPNVRFALMDVTRELPAGEFDVVICSHVIEHLDDPVSFLSALARKVPRLVVKVPLEDSGWMKLVRRDIGIFWMDDEDHRREYTEALLRDQLTRGGWDITELTRGSDLRAAASSKLL